MRGRPRTGSPVFFWNKFRTGVRNSCVSYLNKEIAMSALWLLLLPVAGFAWHVVASVMRLCPGCNEDFVFC